VKGKFGTILLIIGIMAFAVVFVFIVLPGPKSPIYPHKPKQTTIKTTTPKATPTSSVAKSNTYCPAEVHSKTGVAADGHTYTCTKYNDGKWRWKRND